MDQMEERNRLLADKGEPVFALSAILERRDESVKERLRQIAGTDDLAGWLTEPKNLMMLLTALPSADFALFQKAAEVPFLKEQEVFLPMHSGLIGFCLMQPYLVQDEIYLVIPTEIRNLWQDIKKTDFPQKKQLHDTVDAYAQAAVKLYGAIRISDFGEMLRRRADTKLTQEAESLLYDLADGTYYSIADGVLLYRDMTVEEAEPYLAAQETMPRYLPVHEKLLRYGDGDYYDVFHELELWRLEAETQFRDLGEEAAEDKATAFADTLYAVLRVETGDEDHSILFDQFGLAADEARVKEMRQKTRLWCLAGNTPEELLQEWRDGKLRPAVNAPCICGSGKKFKRCHGAN